MQADWTGSIHLFSPGEYVVIAALTSPPARPATAAIAHRFSPRMDRMKMNKLITSK